MKSFYEMIEILEYEQYVDDEGYSYDDEGNVSFVGKKYGGETYGLHGVPTGRDIPRRNAPDPKLVASIRGALEFRHNNFLASLLNQVERGRGLTPKQTQIAHKVLEQLRAEYRKEKARMEEPKINDDAPSSSESERSRVLDKALSIRHSEFLASILDQVRKGQELTEDQKKTVRHNLYKLGMRKEADLFR
jgi:DNA-binding phage protein